MTSADIRTEPPSTAARVRSLIAPTLASAIVLAVLVTLGTWQLQRKAWKEELIAQIAARAYGPAGEPVREANWPDWQAQVDEFRRVQVEGSFLSDKTVSVLGIAELRPSQATQGYYLFVPLRRDDGSVVVVNRGFVPTELHPATLKALEAEPERATVTGLVRAPEERGLFVPENEPQRERWFVRSVANMADARGLRRVAPFYVDQDGGKPANYWPRGGQTPLTLRNTHLGYAVTWYGLAATLAGVFLVFAARRWRDPDGTRAKPQDEP